MGKRRSSGSGGTQLVLEPLRPLVRSNTPVVELSGGSVPLKSGSGTTLASGGSPPLCGAEPLLAARGRWFGVRRPDAGSYRPEGGDVRALQARLWGRMPLSATLCCQSHYSPVPISLTSSEAVYRVLRRRSAVVYGLKEWSELVSSFEEGRAQPSSFWQWCEFKRITPTWRLTQREAMGGAVVSGVAVEGVTVGCVLDAWGVELCALTYGDEVPS